MPQPRLMRTDRDDKVLDRLAFPSTLEAVADLFPSLQTMYRRIGQLVRAGALRHVKGQAVPGRTKPKEVYCTVPAPAKESTLHTEEA